MAVLFLLSIWFISRTLPQPEIETVKKQLEVPTYAPDSGRAGAMNAYKKSGNTSLDDSIGLYDIPVRRSSSVERTVDRTDVLEISANDSPLFLGPKRKPVEIQKRRNQEQLPLSQKKLNEAIAAAKAEREMGIEREKAVKEIQKSRGAAIAAEKEYEDYLKNLRRTAEQPKAPAPAPAPKPQPQIKTPAQAEKKPQETSKIQKPAERREKEFVPEFKPSAPQRAKTAPVPPVPREEENVKQYTPRRQSVHATTSIPRLDVLLNEEIDEGSYNIDDILASLDKRG